MPAVQTALQSHVVLADLLRVQVVDRVPRQLPMLGGAEAECELQLLLTAAGRDARHEARRIGLDGPRARAREADLEREPPTATAGQYRPATRAPAVGRTAGGRGRRDAPRPPAPARVRGRRRRRRLASPGQSDQSLEA